MSSSEVRTSLDPTDLEALRTALLTLRGENVDDLEAARATRATLAEEQAGSDPSLGDVVVNADYMVEDATGIIGMIDAALRRMGDGTYGVCQSCGEPIPLSRLELRPYGTHCVDCSD
jgi:RNA polymerase-binding transcription factor DksA